MKTGWGSDILWNPSEVDTGAIFAVGTSSLFQTVVLIIMVSVESIRKGVLVKLHEHDVGPSVSDVLKILHINTYVYYEWEQKKKKKNNNESFTKSF